jgi:hypothetical protein
MKPSRAKTAPVAVVVATVVVVAVVTVAVVVVVVVDTVVVAAVVAAIATDPTRRRSSLNDAKNSHRNARFLRIAGHRGCAEGILSNNRNPPGNVPGGLFALAVDVALIKGSAWDSACFEVSLQALSSRSTERIPR